MGQEVSHSHFTADEFAAYQQRLKQETMLLKERFEAGEFSAREPVGGFEIEAWLVDDSMRPTSINEEFLQRFDNPLATAELARFNIELNNTPLPIKKDCFQRWDSEFRHLLENANSVANTLQSNVLVIGTLPTLQESDCNVANMSAMKRYKALNESILKARDNRPLKLDIEGAAHLQLTPNSVMMESATTSFQVHIQTPWELAHHYYNASIIASAPVIAVSGNSPFLFNKQLWQETRIPLFEQSVHAGSGLQRVSFGTAYAEQSITECFEENLHDYPVLLPMLFEDEAEKFCHLRLHNGVIWRWNRPLVGFDEDGTPHVRIEHRILPAGPTIADMMANAAFYYGLTQSLMSKMVDGQKIPFEQAKHNFYQCAQHGLEAAITWNDQAYAAGQLTRLLLDDLLPLAEDGLAKLGIDATDIRNYLDIIAKRVESGQTGAVWQIRHAAEVGGDLQRLTRDYLQHQHASSPVHTWE